MATFDGQWRAFVAGVQSADSRPAPEGSVVTHPRDWAILCALRYHVAELRVDLQRALHVPEPAETAGLVLYLPAFGWAEPDSMEGGLMMGFPLSLMEGLPWPMIGRELRRG